MGVEKQGVRLMKKFGVGVVVFILVNILALYFWYLSSISTAADRGAFGDMFGGVNALFSGLAFTGLIYTIYLQMTELREQREELKLTREELAGQKEIMAKQSEQITIQNFESAFFQLLKIHNEVISEISVGDAYYSMEGRDAFEELLKHVNSKYSNFYAQVDADYKKSWNDKDTIKLLKRSIDSFNERQKRPFSKYMLSLFVVAQT